MSVTRADIRNALRQKLQAWPILPTTLNGTITSSATTLTLSANTGFEDRMLLEIESEIIQVVSFTAGSSVIATVIRGVHGTTAAAHTSGVVVNVFPFWGWCDKDLNNYINDSIAWLGDGMVYILKPVTNTLLSGYKDFGLPSGCIYPTGDIVKRIEALDTDGFYKLILGWKHINDRLILNNKLDSNLTVRLWIQTRQVSLTDDSTAIDLDRAKECLVLYCAARALEELLFNRSRYYDYSASLNDRASSADELQRVAYYSYNQAVIIRDQLSRPGLSGYAAIQKA